MGHVCQLQGVQCLLKDLKDGFKYLSKPSQRATRCGIKCGTHGTLDAISGNPLDHHKVLFCGSSALPTAAVLPALVLYATHTCCGRNKGFFKAPAALALNLPIIPGMFGSSHLGFICKHFDWPCLQSSTVSQTMALMMTHIQCMRQF